MVFARTGTDESLFAYSRPVRVVALTTDTFGGRVHAGLGSRRAGGPRRRRCPAGVVTWDGGAGTRQWRDAANWSNDTVPTSTTDVCLEGADHGRGRQRRQRRGHAHDRRGRHRNRRRRRPCTSPANSGWYLTAAEIVNGGTIALGGSNGYDSSLRVGSSFINRGVLEARNETSPPNVRSDSGGVLLNEGLIRISKTLRLYGTLRFVNSGTVEIAEGVLIDAYDPGVTVVQAAGSLDPRVRVYRGRFVHDGGTITDGRIHIESGTLEFDAGSTVSAGTVAGFRTSGSSVLIGDVPARADVHVEGNSGWRLYSDTGFTNRGVLSLGGTTGYATVLKSVGPVVNYGTIRSLTGSAPRYLVGPAFENRGVLQLDRDLELSGTGARLVNHGTVVAADAVHNDEGALVTPAAHLIATGTQSVEQFAGVLDPKVRVSSGRFRYAGGTIGESSRVDLRSATLEFAPGASVPAATTVGFQTSGSVVLEGEIPAGAVVKQLGGSGEKLLWTTGLVNRGTIELGGSNGGYPATLQSNGTVVNHGTIHALAEASPISMQVARLENEGSGTLQADKRISFDLTDAVLVNRGDIVVTADVLYANAPGQTFRQESGSLDPGGRTGAPARSGTWAGR